MRPELNHKELRSIGYAEWIQSMDAEINSEEFFPARVIEVNKNSFLVSDGEHRMVAVLSAKFMFGAEEATDYPTVGDWIQSLQ